MDKSHKRYAEPKKSDTKDCLLYNSTSMKMKNRYNKSIGTEITTEFVIGDELTRKV